MSELTTEQVDLLYRVAHAVVDKFKPSRSDNPTYQKGRQTLVLSVALILAEEIYGVTDIPARF